MCFLIQVLLGFVRVRGNIVFLNLVVMGIMRLRHSAYIIAKLKGLICIFQNKLPCPNVITLKLRYNQGTNTSDTSQIIVLVINH